MSSRLCMVLCSTVLTRSSIPDLPPAVSHNHGSRKYVFSNIVVEYDSDIV